MPNSAPEREVVGPTTQILTPARLAKTVELNVHPCERLNEEFVVDLQQAPHDPDDPYEFLCR